MKVRRRTLSGEARLPRAHQGADGGFGRDTRMTGRTSVQMVVDERSLGGG